MQRGMKPSDPCAPRIGELHIGLDGEGMILSYDGTTPRATLQAYAARELGVAFGAVSALVRYARPLTRQEVWDDSGRDGWLDQWMHDNQVGYYFDTKDHRYDMILADGSPAPDEATVGLRDASQLMKATLPEAKEPPEDWELPENAAMIQYVDDPNGDYPTTVERVLVVE